jgi:phosphoserine phosphatase
VDTSFERGDVNDASSEPPLCVDLDGTIIAADSLKVSLLQLGLTRPWRLPPLAFDTLRGRAWFKKRVADAILPDPGRLPYRPAVLALLREERQRGRRLIMVTAADQRVARLVADHLGIFDAVLGSDGRINLKGPLKLRAIQQFLRGQEFDYMADDMADLVALRAARRAFLVHPSRELLRAARASCRVERVVE